jgi:outer membrane protein OmpA-like peptidoglycan-associated protein
MAYIRIGRDNPALGFFGCGPSCNCPNCRRTANSVPGLGERYVREEEEQAPPPRPSQAPPQRVQPPAPNFGGWGRFGELLPRPRNLLTGGLQLRMPPFETITGFARGGASLGAAQLDRVKRAAEFIARSWRGTSMVTSVRITGYIDPQEWQSDLGQQRAAAVRDALVQAINSQHPGLATRLRWIIEDRGVSSFAKVEIYLWVGPTPMPVPPLVRIPSPAEAARRIVPLRPETPEERIQRILRTLPPAPPQRRTFSEAFWQRVDEQVNSAMSRLGVPQALRGPIRNGARAAIRRGSEELMKRILEASGLPGEAQEAIRGTVRAAAELKVP